MNRMSTPSNTTRRRWLQATAASLALPASAIVQAKPEKEPPLPAVGSALPLAPAPLLGGGQFDPAQADGRVLVLYWWASWCPFCAQQSPEMQKLWAAQQDRGLRMLALSKPWPTCRKKATPSQPRGSALNWPRPTPSPRACR